jgi:hypothetical protein
MAIVARPESADLDMTSTTRTGLLYWPPSRHLKDILKLGRLRISLTPDLPKFAEVVDHQIRGLGSVAERERAATGRLTHRTLQRRERSDNSGGETSFRQRNCAACRGF